MDELIVPVQTPIKLVMTSRDVIHSFYVPAFRMKHDVVPGRYYTAWFEAKTPGDFAIECAEYCGTSHSRMLGKVHVLTEDAYRRWLEGQPTSASASAEGHASPRAISSRPGATWRHGVRVSAAIPSTDNPTSAPRGPAFSIPR